MDQIFLSLSLVFLCLALAFNFLHKCRQNLPPSPFSLPVIGHLHLLKHPFHRSLNTLSHKYGPVFSLRFGSRLVVIVSSSPAVEECFTKNDIAFANRPTNLLTKHLAYNHTTIVTSPYGDHWRNLRRIGSLEIFSTQRINMFRSIRQDEIKRLMRKLGHQSGQGFGQVELKSMFSELTFNIMMRMVAGKRYYGDDVTDEEAKEFRGLMKEITKYGGTSNPEEFVPILRLIDYKGLEKKVIGLGIRTDAFMQGLIEEHRKKKIGLESMNTMIDHLLSMQESQPEYYTDQIIKGLIMVMLLAGTETSAVTLEWAMSHLLNHPHIMEKARLELDIQVSKDELLEEQDITKLNFLQNIISETLRLNPAAPLLVPHMSSSDCTISGYNIPCGTILLVNAWAIHMDPELWDEPTIFKPDRFKIGEDEGHKLIPFGLGRRACPGASLALRVLRLTLGSMIQCFEWKRIGENEIDMTEGKGVTSPKAIPLKALCKPLPIMNNIMLDVYV